MKPLVQFDISLHAAPDDYLAVVEAAASQEKTAIARLVESGPPATQSQRSDLEELLQHYEKQPMQYLAAANAWAKKDLRIFRAFKRYVVVGEATVKALRKLLA